MTVKELIEHLKEFSYEFPELDVVVESELGLTHIEKPRIEFHDRMLRRLVLISPE